MIKKDEIVARLKTLGFKDESIPGVLLDVYGVITGKAMKSYFERLSEEERAKLKDLSSDELVEYFEKNKSNLPNFSKEELEKIHDEVWEDYFKNLSR